MTASSQWLERTLDDSANRRISIPEAFLTADAVLSLAANVLRGARVYPGMMARHLAEELPFLATENILMRAVSLGGDRQELHEAIREYSVDTARRMKETGCGNDLAERCLRMRASSWTRPRSRSSWTSASSSAWPRSSCRLCGKHACAPA